MRDFSNFMHQGCTMASYSIFSILWIPQNKLFKRLHQSFFIQTQHSTLIILSTEYIVASWRETMHVYLIKYLKQYTR